MAFVSTVHQFYAMRLLLGIAEAGFYPGVVLYLTYWFPMRLRAQVCAIFFLGIALAGVVGGPLSGAILTLFDGALGIAGWRWLFLLEALPAVVLGVVTYFYLDDDPAHARWLDASDRGRVIEELSLEHQRQLDAGAPHDFSAAFRNRNVWLMTFANFALLGNAYGVSFWLPQIVRSLGVRVLLVNGFLSAIPFAVACVAMILVSRRADSNGVRRPLVVLSAMVSAAGLALSAVSAQSPVLSLMGLACAMSGALSGLAVLWAIPSIILTGRAAAAAIALMATIGNLSGYFGPMVLGRISERTGHVEYGLLALAASTCIGAACAFGLKLPGRKNTSAVDELTAFTAG